MMPGATAFYRVDRVDDRVASLYYAVPALHTVPDCPWPIQERGETITRGVPVAVTQRPVWDECGGQERDLCPDADTDHRRLVRDCPTCATAAPVTVAL